MREGYWVREKNLEGGGGGRTVGGGGSNGQAAPLTAHRRRGRGADQGPLQSDLRRQRSTMLKTTTRTLLRRRRRRRTPWVTGFVYWGFFFLFLINSSVLCVLCVSVFGLLICWVLLFWFAFVLGNGDWSLPGQRRDVIFAGADVMVRFLFSVIFLFFFIFFWLRNCGLAVSELPVMGSPWASLAVGFARCGLRLDRLFLFLFFFFFFRF